MNKQIDRSIFEKPSTLARAAMADFERVEQDPAFSINMGTWVSLNRARDPATGGWLETNTCAVCLAGSVMLGAVGITPQQADSDHWRAMVESGLGEDERARIYALDDLRT
jgi:hypothetical protein